MVDLRGVVCVCGSMHTHIIHTYTCTHAYILHTCVCALTTRRKVRMFTPAVVGVVESVDPGDGPCRGEVVHTKNLRYVEEGTYTSCNNRMECEDDCTVATRGGECVDGSRE
mgnify:CR=1 FL=1